MEITNVKIYKCTKESKVKAFVDITINDEFVIHKLKIVEGKKDLFVAMPSFKNSKGSFSDICHPIKKECRSNIEKLILDQYNN